MCGTKHRLPPPSQAHQDVKQCAGGYGQNGGARQQEVGLRLGGQPHAAHVIGQQIGQQHAQPLHLLGLRVGAGGGGAFRLDDKVGVVLKNNSGLQVGK